MSFIHDLTQRLEDNRELITEWMRKKRSEVPIPIYGSVDIRDSGWKVAVVDANHFPAGFNNVGSEDEQRISSLLSDHILRKHPECKWVPFILSLTLETLAMLKMLQRLNA